MVFEYSYWWILPAILLSIAVAYYKFRKLSKLPDISFGISFLISVLRFLVIFTLLLLLLNPALSLLHRIKEKPLLVVAQDNSVSIMKNKDSLYYQQEYKESLADMVARLENNFEVVKLTFCKSITKEGEIDYSENRTDLSAVIEYVNRNFITRQPEGMILLTDGIYNSGVNPRYKIPSFPIYTVALGDTTHYPDVYIRSMEVNKFNFLNTLFPLRAEIAALKQQGRTLKCVLRENGRVIGEKKLKIDRENFLTAIDFEVEAKQKGVLRYSIDIETDFAERTQENNRAETYVHIIDNSAKIAFFAEAPHPDIAAIVNAANVSGIYQCQQHHFNEAMDTLQAHLIILHNPRPENPGYQNLLKEAQKRKIAIWYLLTGKKNIMDFARFNNHYTVNFTTDLNEYATPAMNSLFPYFEFTDEEVAGYAVYPPLTVPFGEIHPGAGRLLFTQKVKNTVTSNGMIGFYEQQGSRIAYLWGEGLWRWRLYSYGENGNHELFNTLINKIIGYLASQKGNERFIHDFRPVYGETEEAIVNAELYNESYELVNSPDVKLDLKHRDKVFNYLLGRNGEKYRINLGNLPAGEYAYRLSANLKGEVFEKSGVFYVQSNNPELNNMVADRALLQELAVNSGGEMFEARNLESLPQVWERNEKLKPVYKIETEFLDLSQMQILGFILLLLLCIEWFLLKYYAD